MNLVFTEVFTGLQSILSKIQDVAAIYNDDPVLYRSALDAFVIKYPIADAKLVDARFK